MSCIGEIGDIYIKCAEIESMDAADAAGILMRRRGCFVVTYADSFLSTAVVGRARTCSPADVHDMARTCCPLKQSQRRLTSCDQVFSPLDTEALGIG